MPQHAIAPHTRKHPQLCLDVIGLKTHVSEERYSSNDSKEWIKLIRSIMFQWCVIGSLMTPPPYRLQQRRHLTERQHRSRWGTQMRWQSYKQLRLTQITLTSHEVIQYNYIFVYMKVIFSTTVMSRGWKVWGSRHRPTTILQNRMLFLVLFNHISLDVPWLLIPSKPYDKRYQQNTYSSTYT